MFFYTFLFCSFLFYGNIEIYLLTLKPTQYLPTVRIIHEIMSCFILFCHFIWFHLLYLTIIPSTTRTVSICIAVDLKSIMMLCSILRYDLLSFTFICYIFIDVKSTVTQTDKQIFSYQSSSIALNTSSNSESVLYFSLKLSNSAFALFKSD